jgi:hypothetical protein
MPWRYRGKDEFRLDGRKIRTLRRQREVCGTHAILAPSFDAACCVMVIGVVSIRGVRGCATRPPIKGGATLRGRSKQRPNGEMASLIRSTESKRTTALIDWEGFEARVFHAEEGPGLLGARYVDAALGRRR